MKNRYLKSAAASAVVLLTVTCGQIQNPVSDLTNRYPTGSLTGTGSRSSSSSDSGSSESVSQNSSSGSSSASGSASSQNGAFSDNLVIGVTDERGTLTEKPNNIFKPGQWVHGINKKTSKDIQSKYDGKDVTVTFEFESSGKKLATHRFTRKVDNVTNDLFSFNILPDPHSTQMKSQRWDWSGDLAAALSKLSKGEHEITIRGFLESEKNKDQFVQGRFIYNNQDGNGKMKETAALINKERSFDIMKENEEFSKKHGRAADNVEQVQTTVRNNCGRDVVITFANQSNSSINIKLYHLQSMKITVNDGESVYISWKGKSTFSGPTIGSFEKGKMVNLCN